MTSKEAREFLRSHVLGLVAIFIALTGTALASQQSGTSGGPKASASVVTDAKFKKLKKRVAALEAKASPTVGSADVANTSLGGVDLKNTYTSVSAGEGVNGGVSADETASCGSDRLLGGGYSWSADPTFVDMHTNAPGGIGGAANPNSWVAQGSTSTNGNVLFAWAVCLPV